MDPKDLAGISVYADLMTVIKDRGFSDAQASELFLKITTQVEMEVVEEIVSSLDEEQVKILDSLPDGADAQEIADKLGLDGEVVDGIRAEKLAEVLEEVLPEIDKETPEASPEPQN